MIRQCFLRLSSISLLYTLFAVVFSLLITVAAHPVAAAAGDLDTSFDSDGKVTTEVGSLMTLLAPLPSSPTVRLWRRVTVTTVVTGTLHSCATTRMAH